MPILGEASGTIGCWIKGGCFTAGTPVIMQDGTTKAIEEVVQGDQVLSKDEKTGRIEASRVAQVSRRTVGRVVRVTLTNPETQKSQTLTATADHPFYVAGKGFVPAGQLGIGTSIVTRAGPALTVSGSALLPEQVGGYVVYNLTVEGDHTYFVGSVDGGAWVHNYDCTVIGRMEDLKKYANNDAVDTWWKTGRIPERDGGGKVTWPENKAWLDERIQRGDSFGIATPESSLGTKNIEDEPNGSMI